LAEKTCQDKLSTSSLWTLVNYALQKFNNTETWIHGDEYSDCWVERNFFSHEVERLFALFDRILLIIIISFISTIFAIRLL
jgi:hypothetical protein